MNGVEMNEIDQLFLLLINSNDYGDLIYYSEQIAKYVERKPIITQEKINYFLQSLETKKGKIELLTALSDYNIELTDLALLETLKNISKGDDDDLVFYVIYTICSCNEELAKWLLEHFDDEYKFAPERSMVRATLEKKIKR